MDDSGLLTIQDGLHLELLDMRAHVWGVEQDLQKVVKTGELPVHAGQWRGLTAQNPSESRHRYRRPQGRIACINSRWTRNADVMNGQPPSHSPSLANRDMRCSGPWALTRVRPFLLDSDPYYA